MGIRIILADDHNIIRQGLRAMLEQQADMEVVAEAQDGREILSLASSLDPDIIIMDVAMPNLNGIEATRQITQHGGGGKVKILALSMHADKRFAAGMLSAGASGYLLKDCAFDELVQAIRTVRAGQVFLSPAITDVVVEDYVSRVSAADDSAFAVLTAREREVLQLMAEGQSTKDAAALLHVSPKTVETHRRQIMEKLGIFSVAELTKYAIREGLVSLDS
jgi:two-component system, NarL family, response regulator NreC